jgi:hypothetical protein
MFTRHRYAFALHLARSPMDVGRHRRTLAGWSEVRIPQAVARFSIAGEECSVQGSWKNLRSRECRGRAALQRRLKSLLTLARPCKGRSSTALEVSMLLFIGATPSTLPTSALHPPTAQRDMRCGRPPAALPAEWSAHRSTEFAQKDLSSDSQSKPA